MRTTGTYEISSTTGKKIKAFIPYPLPPKEFEFNEKMIVLLVDAEAQLAKLNLTCEIIPSISIKWFLYMFARKEAVLSSQIEGTQATLVDLLKMEVTKNPPKNTDIEEYFNYIHALNYALKELESETGLPISIRLFLETHKRLLRGTRGATKQPGVIRSSQNWLGGTHSGNAIFVPPPPHRVKDLLSTLENYIHKDENDDDLHPLIRIGLIHAQFETIHPFLDGNGRLGRLLISLLLKHWNYLNCPLLYLSLFFKTYRKEYYQKLNAVRTEGDWEGWIEFFLEGVASVASVAFETIRNLHSIINKNRKKLHKSKNANISSVRLFEILPKHPIIVASQVMKLLNCSRPTAKKTLKILENVGILLIVDNSHMFMEYLSELIIGTEMI